MRESPEGIIEQGEKKSDNLEDKSQCYIDSLHNDKVIII